MSDTTLYIVASFNNPISVDMIEENISEAIQISKKYDLPVKFKYKHVQVQVDSDTCIEKKLIWIDGYLTAMKRL